MLAVNIFYFFFCFFLDINKEIRPNCESFKDPNHYHRYSYHYYQKKKKRKILFQPPQLPSRADFIDLYFIFWKIFPTKKKNQNFQFNKKIQENFNFFGSKNETKNFFLFHHLKVRQSVSQSVKKRKKHRYK